MNVRAFLAAVVVACVGCGGAEVSSSPGDPPSETGGRPKQVPPASSATDPDPRRDTAGTAPVANTGQTTEAQGEAAFVGGLIGSQVVLDHPELNECSGLGFSIRKPDCVWSHNDSGDVARWLSFDVHSGKPVGSCRLQGAEAIDWEDMTLVPIRPDATADPSAVQNDNYLVAADCGDNFRSRPFVTLYACIEPDPRRDTRVPRSRWASLRVTYPGGPMDCEAVWYDNQRDVIRFLGKHVMPWVSLVEIPAGLLRARMRSADAEPDLEDQPRQQAEKPIRGRLVTKLSLPLATAADRDPETGDVWVVSYWQAWRLPASLLNGMPNEERDSGDGGSRKPLVMPEPYPLPQWKQIEAVAVDGKSNVWISSEGESAPLGLLLFEDRR